MTKYLVSGYIGFDNFGDEAIQRVLTQQLKEQNAEKITLISSNPQKTSEMYGVYSCGMFNFFKPLIESDVLISGGGSLLQDITSLKSLLYYLGVIYSALILNKKVEIYAQGIGPINSEFGKFFTKFALKNASKISVRDKESQELLKTWGIESELVKDPIFNLKIEQKNIPGTLGVQLRDYRGLEIDFLTSLAQEIKTNFSDKKIKIISLQDKIDLKISKQFQKILFDLGLDSEIKNNLDIDSAIKEISELEYIIGMRFHSLVIALKSGVKILGINYDPKVQKLSEEYNFPIIDLNQQNLSNEFDKLINS